MTPHPARARRHEPAGRRRRRDPGRPPGRGFPRRVLSAAVLTALTVIGLTATAVPSFAAAPEGVIDGHDATRVWGWAKDADCGDAPSIVAVHPDYNENGVIDAGEQTLFVKADVNRPDVGPHGFDIPFAFRSGTLVRVSVYGGRDAACTQDQVVPLGTFRVSSPPVGKFLDIARDGAADVVSGWARDPDSCPDAATADCTPTFVHIYTRTPSQQDFVKVAEQKADLPRPGGLRTGFAVRLTLTSDTQVKVVGIGRDASGARDFQDVELTSSPHHYCGNGVDLTPEQTQVFIDRVTARSDATLRTRYPGVGAAYAGPVGARAAVRPCSFVAAGTRPADFRADLSPEKSAGELDVPALNVQVLYNPTPGTNGGVAFGLGFGTNKRELQFYAIVRFYGQFAPPPSTVEAVWSKYSVIGRTSATVTTTAGFGTATDATLKKALQQIGVDGASIIGFGSTFSNPALSIPLQGAAGAAKPGALYGGGYGVAFVQNGGGIIGKGVPASNAVRINTVVANLGKPAPNRLAPAVAGGNATITTPISNSDLTNPLIGLRTAIKNQLPPGLLDNPGRMSVATAEAVTKRLANVLTASPQLVRNASLDARKLVSEYQRTGYRQFPERSPAPAVPPLDQDDIGRYLYLFWQLMREGPVPVF